MKVKEIMNKAFVVDDDISLKAAAKMMSDKNIGCLTVMKNDKIAGIITEKDVMKNVSRLGDRISGIMSRDVTTIGKNDTLEEAAEIMAQKKIKRLPVVNKGELVGIITATDILAHSDDLNEEFFFD
jgi:CBS domain-containing protein